MNKTAALGVFLLAQGLAACDSASRTPTSPSAVSPPGISTTPPIPPAAPAPPATLVLFTDPRTGFSTSDLRDAGGQIVQFDSAGELIWTADGTRLRGYWARRHEIPVAAGCVCSLIVRFGTDNGERRAYLTADYIHDNPGTLVDLEVEGGALRVGQTGIFAPGTYSQTGVITEPTPAGPVPLAGAGVWRLNEERGGWQVAVTDDEGYYELRGLYDGSRVVTLIKDGYVTVVQDVVIDGDTRYDGQLAKR